LQLIVENKIDGISAEKRAGMYARLLGKPVALSADNSICNICEALVTSYDILLSHFPVETYKEGRGCPHCIGGRNE
jgi:hypothetical protein